MSYTKPHRPGRPSVSTRPLAGPGELEVTVSCRHARTRTGWRTGPTITPRVAVCASLMHHAVTENCTCLIRLWAQYRTPEAPASLVGLVQRFGELWADVEDQQRRRGYALLDMAAARAQLVGVNG